MKKLQLLVIALSGIILALLAGEAFLHFFPALSFEAMCSCPEIRPTLKDVYRASPLTGYEIVPNSTPDVNSFGMRDREYTLSKPKGVFRIVLLGDSITEGGRWSYYLEEKLNQDGRYEILNCAVSGWGLYEYWADLKNRGLKFDPDLVLIGFCLNDIRSYNMVRTILHDARIRKSEFFYLVGRKGADISRTLRVDPWLLRYSYLYRLLLSFEIWLDNHRAKKMDVNREPSAILAEMKTISKGRILGVIFPYLKPFKEYDSHESLEYYDTMEELNVAGIKYLDLTNYFNSYGDKITGFRSKAEDKIHFNEEANRMKADIIYKWLKKYLEQQKRSAAKL